MCIVFFSKLYVFKVPSLLARKSEKRFLGSGVFCMLIQNRARYRLRHLDRDSVLSGLGARGGRNILRTRDYQYARDIASPFFLGERKRKQSYRRDIFKTWHVRR